MNLSIKIVPIRVTERTKSILVNVITSGKCICFGCKNGVSYNGYSSIHRSSSDDTIRVFNLVKHRRKAVRDKNGKTIKATPAYWEAYVYDFSLELLRIMGLNVRQNRRNFVLYKK